MTLDNIEKGADIKSPLKNDGDFIILFKSLLSNINFKLAGMMFIFGFIIFSNLFVDKVIGSFQNTIENDTVNTKGSIIQLALYTGMLIILDLAIKGNML